MATPSYVLKKIPEDFIVKELITLPLEPGNIQYYWMKKERHTTIGAISRLAELSNIPLSLFGYAGNKDSFAVTEQAISVRTPLRVLDASRITCEHRGTGTRPLSLGDNTGNAFRIVVRSVDAIPHLRETFVNYFGEQRFSTGNVRIGKLLVTKQFSAAASAISLQHDNVAILHKQKTRDPLAVLRAIPKKLLQLYIHAYQSELWNNLAYHVLTKHIRVTDLPLLGFGTERNSVLDTIIDAVLAKESVSLRDFIIPQLPHASTEGGVRAIFTSATNVRMTSLEPDEFFAEKQKFTFSFELPKGVYATEFIRQVFSPPKEPPLPPPELVDPLK